jgi:hypothetical protein
MPIDGVFDEPDKSHIGSLMDDPKHWIRRAEEIRVLAAKMTDIESKRMLLKIADDYEKVAARAEQRAAGKHPPPE